MPEDTQATIINLRRQAYRPLHSARMCDTSKKEKKRDNSFLCLESHLLILAMNNPFSMYPYQVS